MSMRDIRGYRCHICRGPILSHHPSKHKILKSGKLIQIHSHYRDCNGIEPEPEPKSFTAPKGAT